MAYTQQIRILEAKLKQLQRGPHNADNIGKVLQIQTEIRKMRRLEWEENYERVKLEEDR
jgi:hypothetical protein